MDSPSSGPSSFTARKKMVRGQFSKTRMCEFYGKQQCAKGGRCPFAHDATELQAAPNLDKTSICKKWLGGKCLAPSDQCAFAHGAHELRTTHQGLALARRAQITEVAPASPPTEVAHYEGTHRLPSAQIPPTRDLRLPKADAFVGPSSALIYSAFPSQASKMAEEAVRNLMRQGTYPPEANVLGDAFLMVERAVEQLLMQAMPESYED